MSLSSQGWDIIKTTDPNNQKILPYPNKKYTEFEDSGYGDFSDTDSNVHIIYQVNDGGLLPFCDALMGTHRFVNEAAGILAINRDPPEQHPENTNFYCVNTNYKRYGVAGQDEVFNDPTNPDFPEIVGRWTMARIDATFKPLGYEALEDDELPDIEILDPPTDPEGGSFITVVDEKFRYVTREFNQVIQYITIDPGSMAFVCKCTSNPPPINSVPGKVYTFTEKTMIWHKVPARTFASIGQVSDRFDCVYPGPYIMNQVRRGVGTCFDPPNLRTVNSLAGRLNLYNFDGHAPGTVLFSGFHPKLNRPNLANGLYTWDLEYRFLIQDNGIQQCFDEIANELIPVDYQFEAPNIDLATCSPYTVNGQPVQPFHAGPNYIFDFANCNDWNLITDTGTVDGNGIYQFGDLNMLFWIRSNG